MIEEGRVAIDGKTVETPATLLDSLNGVTVDGRAVREPEAARLFRYHKPAGLLTTERDPEGRPTIYDRLPPGLPRLMPVGRLDLNTEGLLLLTTDGGLKRQLELPSSGVERIYRARTFGEISQAQLEDLIAGIEIEGIRYGPIDANLERRTGRNQWIEVKLKEGKNREVRRVLEHLGLQVSRLIRIAYGPFPLEDLPVGGVDEVRQHDMVAFRKALEGGTATGLATMSVSRTAAPPRRSDAQKGERPPEKGPVAPRTARPPRAASSAGGKPSEGARAGRASAWRAAHPDRAARDDEPQRSTSRSPGSSRPDRGRPSFGAGKAPARGGTSRPPRDRRDDEASA
ncbi:MAG: pseudouridine synthase, partial [Alphaproteobacteria bacterium]|nr:pseudouridine synthase [Alphaproteobacteria bacterium]